MCIGNYPGQGSIRGKLHQEFSKLGGPACKDEDADQFNKQESKGDFFCFSPGSHTCKEGRNRGAQVGAKQKRYAGIQGDQSLGSKYNHDPYKCTA